MMSSAIAPTASASRTSAWQRGTDWSRQCWTMTGIRVRLEATFYRNGDFNAFLNFSRCQQQRHLKVSCAQALCRGNPAGGGLPRRLILRGRLIRGIRTELPDAAGKVPDGGDHQGGGKVPRAARRDTRVRTLQLCQLLKKVNLNCVLYCFSALRRNVHKVMFHKGLSPGSIWNRIMNIPEVQELYKNIYIFAEFRYFSLSPGPLAPEVLQPQPLLPGARDPPERTAAAAATGREQQQRQQQETP